MTAALEMGDVSADSSLNRSRDEMLKKHKKLPCPLDKGCEEDLGDEETVSFVYLRKLRMLQRMRELDVVQRYALNNVRSGRRWVLMVPTSLGAVGQRRVLMVHSRVPDALLWGWLAVCGVASGA